MLRGSEPILHNGNVIGVTTSAGYGYTVAKTIAYGYVPSDKADPLESFEIECYKKIYPATCEPERVLYDAERKKILC